MGLNPGGIEKAQGGSIFRPGCVDVGEFLRIHAEKPYGARGEEAIRQLANLELNARSGTEVGR